MTTRLSVLWTLALMGAFALASGYNLGNYFPIRSDDVVIMSASYKLATDGRYASDLLTGFAHADDYFFMNLPAINMLQAVTFKLFGAGLWQARLPSVVCGVVLVGVVGRLAFRWDGLVASVIAPTLLVFWRTNLIGSEPRPPLLALAQSARYDLAVIAFVWVTILFLDQLLRRPSRGLAIAVGVCAGIAVLTQFYGIGVVLVVAAAYGRRWHCGALTRGMTYATGGAFLAVVLPYLAYAVMHRGAFAAQAALHGDRVNFLNLAFYAGNVIAEPSRYLNITDTVVLSGTSLTTAPLGAWVLALGVIPAIALLVMNRREADAHRELLWLSGAGSLLALALVEQTKAIIYASFVMPTLCLVMAMALGGVMRWCLVASRQRTARLVVMVGLLGLLGVIVADGLLGYRYNYREARRVSLYLDVGARLEMAFEPTATILGSWRWWWALHEHPYRAVNSLLQTWVIDTDEGRPTTFEAQVAASGADYVILDGDARGDLDRSPLMLRDEVAAFLEACTTVLTTWDDPTYGHVEIRRVTCGRT